MFLSVDLRRAVEEYLDRCFSTEEPPRVSELAALLGISRETLSRDFAGEYGLPLSAYLKQRQVDHAKRLLTRSELSTTRIAYLCGFGTRRTFYRSFRRATATTPDEYRRMNVRHS
jgi:AraC-like DNA-binding protein